MICPDGVLCQGTGARVWGSSRQVRSLSPCARPMPVSSTVWPVMSRANTEAGRLTPCSRAFSKALV
ncbi:hypothetical protein MBH78_16480 [Oceanimonas sp. NS1]|nr:hypothetical protein [Oceanimonas sp. NS1]